MEEDKIKKAAQTLFDANNGKFVPVDDFVNASDTILCAMRNEITFQQVLQWCIDKGYVQN